MSSLYFGLGKERIKLFEVTRMWGKLAEEYQGSLGWFLDDDENNPIQPPKGIGGIYPTRRETYLEITYLPDEINEHQIKEYLMSLGIETGKIEDYKISFGKLILKIVLYPFVAIFGYSVIFVLWIMGKLDDKK